ncbi:MAG: hypothetical protein EBR05_12270, partial [Marivivens sp.]|nr:hypothetical protein [Marivivens sp.]
NMEAKIKLTKTMLDKCIIDANKTVQQFLTDDFEMSYDDPYFTQQWYNEKTQRFERGKLTVTGEYADGERVDVRFYRSGSRADKRISIQKLKQYAEAGDTIVLTSNAWDEDDETEYLIHINIVRQTDAA